MKKSSFLIAVLLLLAFSTNAQVQIPALSPDITIKQKVGLTNFEINYSRPSLKGRNMYKEIIPLGVLWRFGANANTTITFDTPINFAGADLQPGNYAMFAIPDKEEWGILIYEYEGKWMPPNNLNSSDVVASVRVKSHDALSTQKKETFTISFEDLSNFDNFKLVVEWEHTQVIIPIKLPTHKLANESIAKVINQGNPTERDFYRSASYYLHAGNDSELELASEYVDKAISMNEDAPTYYYHTKALILSKLGKNKEAIEAAKKSLSIAESQNFDEYVRKNKVLIATLDSE